MAGAGSAQTPATSLHFVSTSQKGAGFMPKGAPRQGDRLGFGDRITGDDTGYDRGVCTIVGRPQILCTIQVQLSKGTLTVQGMLPERANGTPVAITGGTGAYNGARGTALVTDHGQRPHRRRHHPPALTPGRAARRACSSSLMRCCRSTRSGTTLPRAAAGR